MRKQSSEDTKITIDLQPNGEYLQTVITKTQLTKFDLNDKLAGIDMNKRSIEHEFARLKNEYKQLIEEEDMLLKVLSNLGDDGLTLEEVMEADSTLEEALPTKDKVENKEEEV